MKNTAPNSINKTQYDDIVGFVSKLTSERFHTLNLSDDIANAILVKLMTCAAFSDPAWSVVDYIISAFPNAVEDVFNSYQKLSYRFCKRKTQDHSLSEDISQEAIRLLLTSKQRINEVYPWLRQVTHNLLCKHWETKAKEDDLYQRLCVEASLLQDIMSTGISIDREGLSPALTKELLASDEYRDYDTMCSYKNNKEYAAEMNVSESLARKRKEKTFRNLRAKILLAMGWDSSADILSYSQYNAIQKFIRNLMIIAGSGANSHKKSALFPELAQALEGIKSIDDWGITMVDNRRFRLHIFHLSQNMQPIIATFFIAMNERNHVSVENCKKDEIIGAHPIPANIQIPKEMGKALWSYEKIISLLNT